MLLVPFYLKITYFFSFFVYFWVVLLGTGSETNISYWGVLLGVVLIITIGYFFYDKYLNKNQRSFSYYVTVMSTLIAILSCLLFLFVSFYYLFLSELPSFIPPNMIRVSLGIGAFGVVYSTMTIVDDLRKKAVETKSFDVQQKVTKEKNYSSSNMVSDEIIGITTGGNQDDKKN